MNAKSSTRLRLERLETRNMLSAMGIPFALPMALPRLPAAPGEYSRIGGHPITQAVLQDAVQNVAAMPNANPTLLPDQLARAHSDSSNAKIALLANPTLTSDLLSPGLDISSYAQPAVRGRVRDTVPRDDFPQFGQPTSDTALLSDSTPEAAAGLADSGVVEMQILSVTNLVVVGYGTDGQLNVSTSSEMSYTVAFVPGLKMTGLDRQPLHGAASGLSDPTDLATPESPLQQGFPGGLGLDAPPAFDPAAPLYESGDVLVSVEISPVSHGSAGVRGLPNHSFEMAAQPSLDSNLASSVEVSLPPVKSNAPDPPAVYDMGRVGDQAVAPETTLPLAASLANPPANNNVAFSDAAISNSTEGGFIAIDETPAATLRPGSAPSYNTGFQNAAGVALDLGDWLSNILPNSPKPADSGILSGKAARAVRILWPRSLRGAPGIQQSAVDAEEGGSIELTSAAPVAASDAALLAAESSEGNAASQRSDFRPESGIGLFCDIEVAAAPVLPMDGSAWCATSGQHGGSVIAGPGAPPWKADPATGRVPPLSKLPRSTTARLEDGLPLLFGVAILVSQGGLRLEEQVPERERRVRCTENLRQPPA